MTRLFLSLLFATLIFDGTHELTLGRYQEYKAADTKEQNDHTLEILAQTASPPRGREKPH